STIVISNYGPTALDARDYILYDYSAGSISGSFAATPIWASAVTNSVTTTATVVNDTGNKRVVLRVAVASPAPTASNVGGGPVCSTGSPLQVTLDGSEADVTYQLYRNSTIPVGSPQTGTGSAMNSVSDWGSLTTAGTYTIVGSRFSCTTTNTGSAVINQGS